MPNSNQILITDFSSEGYGIGRDENGRVVMIKGAVPGDTVEYEVRTTEARVAFGEVVKIIDPSEHRVDHPCPHYAEGCPGCLLGIFDYQEGLKWKQRQLRETLIRIGKMQYPPIEEMTASPETWGYRDRLELHLFESAGKLRLGYVNGQELIAIEDCLLANAAVRTALRNIQPVIRSGEYPGRYLPIRLLLRDNGRGNSTATFFVWKLNRWVFWLIEAMMEKAGIAGGEIRKMISVNSRLTVSKYVKEYGNIDLRRKICGQEILLPPIAFSQTNEEVEKEMHAAIFSLIPDNQSILELYGGFGSISLNYLIGKGGKAFVTDVAGDSVYAGEEFAKKQGLPAEFLPADAAWMKPESYPHHEFDGVIADPPRNGLHKEVIAWLNYREVPHLIYISCHSAALARDLTKLKSYLPMKFIPFDMFPQTSELETVCLLERKNK